MLCLLNKVVPSVCLLVTIFSFLLLTADGHGELTVCTYNLWNVMFSWEIRMRHIASTIATMKFIGLTCLMMDVIPIVGTLNLFFQKREIDIAMIKVRQAECDVLLLQEVRLHADRSRSQADFLQQLLPEFGWAAARLADHVKKPEHSYWSGWEMEGLAVLSKMALGEVRAEKLSKVHGPDSNQRVALHVPILVQPQTTVHVLVVHLSYHRQQQCQNAAEILRYIDRNKLTHVLVAGDFNAYADFPGPIQMFQTHDRRAGDGGRQCTVSLMTPLSSTVPVFHDVWEATHPGVPGFTFSNMPEPGLTSRPDRILISSSLRAKQVSLHGHGADYKASYSTDIFMHRLRRVMGAAQDTFGQHHGFSCLQDCGPHGHCRCGVCVKLGEEGSCALPHCQECSSGMFVGLCCFLAITAVLASLAGTAAVKILVVASRLDQSGSSLLPGVSCCLCNPLIVRQPTVTGRHGLGKILRSVGLGRLPPVQLLLSSLMLMACLLCVAAAVFKPLLDTAGAVLQEEHFPSDHLMIAAKLETL